MPNDPIHVIEAQWILETQLPDGAIPAYQIPSGFKGSCSINGYEGNVAAWGMLHGGPDFGPAARKWIMWYLDHVNLPDHNGIHGTIYDYVTTEGILTTGRNYENTDAAAAAFITLCRKYAEVTGDCATLRDHKPEIRSVIEAMRSTMQFDGLTRSSPDGDVVGLINNCEVVVGMRDASWLYANVFNQDRCAPARHHGYKGIADAVAAAIGARMWDHSHDMWVVTLDGSGNGQSSTWTDWHESLAQIWPVKAGVDLWPRMFDVSWPTWMDCDNPDGNPWAVIPYVASIVGYQDYAQQWLRAARRKFIDADHPTPWNPADAGYTAAVSWLLEARQ